MTLFEQPDEKKMYSQDYIKLITGTCGCDESDTKSWFRHFPPYCVIIYAPGYDEDDVKFPYHFSDLPNRCSSTTDNALIGGQGKEE